jgi:hypothetical protein
VRSPWRSAAGDTIGPHEISCSPFSDLNLAILASAWFAHMFRNPSMIYATMAGTISPASLFFGVLTRLLTDVAAMCVSGFGCGNLNASSDGAVSHASRSSWARMAPRGNHRCDIATGVATDEVREASQSHAFESPSLGECTDARTARSRSARLRVARR